MKWMAWSYQDLMTAPLDYINVIIEMINEESAEIERIRNK